MPKRRAAAGSSPDFFDDMSTVLDAVPYGAEDAESSSVWAVDPADARTRAAAEKKDEPSAPAEPSAQDPAPTIVDHQLGTRMRETLVNQTLVMAPLPKPAPTPSNEPSVIVDAGSTLILGSPGAPLVIPDPPRTEPVLQGRGAIDPDPTEMTFASPKDRRPWSQETYGDHGRLSTELTATQRPVLVAHVIAPRRDYVVFAAIVAWTLAVAFGGYLIAKHRAAQMEPVPASSAAPKASHSPPR